MERCAPLHAFSEAVTSLGVGTSLEQNHIWNINSYYCSEGWLLLKRSTSLDGNVGIKKQNSNTQ